MDQSTKVEERITRPVVSYDNPVKLFSIVIVLAVVLGVITGYVLSQKGGGNGIMSAPALVGAPKTAQQDTQTFKDFAEGIIRNKPQPSDGQYTEGTHLLERQNAVPVALTSSVVDLNQYVGKKVKVYGETQKALKAGWLMDVGKVEVEQ